MDLKSKIVKAITEVMPKDKDGNIKDKCLHSDIVVAVQQVKNIDSIGLVSIPFEHLEWCMKKYGAIPTDWRHFMEDLENEC